MRFSVWAPAARRVRPLTGCSGGPAATIFAMTEPARLISSSMVNTPDGLTAAGKSAQDSVPGTGSKCTRRYTPPYAPARSWRCSVTTALASPHCSR